MKNVYQIIFLLLASIFLYSCGGTEQEHVHDYSVTKVIEPTCEAQGYTEHKCECGDVIKDNYWAALDHDIVQDKKVNPTCLRNGLGEGEHCTRCDYKVEQVVIDRLEHDYDSNTNICNQCKVNKYSINLSFEFDEEAQGYVVESIGSEINCIITIPETYKSYPVIGIKEGAFRLNKATLGYNDHIIEINIPESVTYIGDSAFRNCNYLENINVDENNQYYKSIDGTLYTKDGKTLLVYAIGKKENNLIIPEGVTTIVKYAFYNCQNLVSVTFPESLVDIGKGAFDLCRSLTNIKFSNGLKTIAEDAFGGCGNLITLDLPSTLETIGDRAFANCDNVTTITIGDNLSNIGVYAFDCESLTNINVSKNNKYFSSIDGNLYSKDGTVLLLYAIGKDSKTFVVPSSVTTIKVNAINVRNNLITIIIPESVTTIESYAINNVHYYINVYCKASTKPSGFEKKWIDYDNENNVNIVWGYTEE